MGEAGFEGAGAHGCDGDGVGGGIVAVVAVDLLQAAAQFALLLGGKLRVGLAELGVAPLIEDEGGFAMQPVGGPIGGNVAAVTPDGAHFHAAESLPDILAAADVAIGDHDGAGGVDDAGGKRRHLLINASADPA